jgi:hypothetical protein
MPAGITYFGAVIRGSGSNLTPTLIQPPADVLAAWSQGWTGAAKNILLVDGFQAPASCSNSSACHGIIVTMTSDNIAPAAAKFALNASLNNNLSIPGSVFNILGGNISTTTQMHVANFSFTYSNNAQGDTTASAWVNFINGSNNVANAIITDAVITKSSGNNSAADAYVDSPMVRAFTNDANIASRLLIIGALDGHGNTSSPTSIASYSNRAGTNNIAQSRYVLASGNTPFDSLRINGSAINSGVGTSYSGPVVAGYAAILRQKFPNLDAVKTSSIILDTARYDTLTCNPNCDPAIYGRGEASLSRALAPVGRLR